MELVDYVKRALDRYDHPEELHNVSGGFPRGELGWAMAKDLRECLVKHSQQSDEACSHQEQKEYHGFVCCKCGALTAPIVQGG